MLPSWEYEYCNSNTSSGAIVSSEPISEGLDESSRVEVFGPRILVQAVFFFRDVQNSQGSQGDSYTH